MKTKETKETTQHLFIEFLGYDYPSDNSYSLISGDRTFTFTAIAQKRGFMVFLCECDNLPNEQQIKYLTNRIKGCIFENFIIFKTADNELWCWADLDYTKNTRSRVLIVEYLQVSNKTYDSFLTALSFGLAEEKNLTLIKVIEKIRNAFKIFAVFNL